MNLKRRNRERAHLDGDTPIITAYNYVTRTLTGVHFETRVLDVCRVEYRYHGIGPWTQKSVVSWTDTTITFASTVPNPGPSDLLRVTNRHGHTSNAWLVIVESGK